MSHAAPSGGPGARATGLISAAAGSRQSFYAYKVGDNDLVLRQLRQSSTLLTWKALVLQSPS
jgi:hypothetical protein